MSARMPEGPRLPHLVIAGAPKCGTSSAFEWLRLHPEICGSSVKETLVLMDEPEAGARSFQHLGEAAYAHFFDPRGDEHVLLEASPEYLEQKTALAVLPGLPSSPRILAIVRDPVQRILSAYRFEKHNLASVAAAGSLTDFLATDRGRRVLETSHYWRHLEPWQKALGPDRLRVWVFESMIRTPEEHLSSLCRWMGIDDGYYEGRELAVRNPTARLRSRRLHRFGEKLAPRLPGAWVNRLLPVYQKINARRPDAPSMVDREILGALSREFTPGIEALAQAFELDLDHWIDRGET